MMVVVMMMALTMMVVVMMTLMMVVVIDGNDRKMDLCTILLGGTRARLGLVEDARLINNKLSLGQQQLSMYLNDYNFRRRS